jgi:Ca-activated chloride channel family protein
MIAVLALLFMVVGCGYPSPCKEADSTWRPAASRLNPMTNRIHNQGGLALDYDEYLVVTTGAAPLGNPSNDGQRLKGGQLVAKQGEKTIPIPLKHTDVSAQISLSIASVRVKQQYHNPYDGKIEAVYQFPLPSDAAVRDFIMVIGDRKIRGIIREKAEAEKIYAEAKRQGKVASLLTQHRPNIFEQAVANIEPGKAIDIDITYFHALPFAGDSYEFHFPMVVGPRFNPPGSTDGIGAAPRGGAGEQKTNIEYLAPDEITSHDISLTVDLDAGLPIGTLESPSHKIVVAEKSETRGVIKLAEGDRIPNKDFVLRYSVARKKTQAAMVAHRDEKGGTFLLTLQPPKELADIPAAPREMVFVLDCSGSMEGAPLAIAKRSLERCLRRLKPTDTFQIVRFSDNASAFGPKPVPATEQNVARAIKHVASLDSEGGTMMIEGIKAALDFPHDPERFRIVSFMTDGYIGNEREILGEIRARLGAARIFSFGIGSSVNRYLIESMAVVGRGVVAYVGLNQDGERAVDRLYQEIEHPALADVKIDFGALKASNVFPSTIPDLFLGRPVLITGRFEGKGPATIKITGTMGGRRHEMTLTVEPKETHPALPALWARAKIAELDYQMAWTTNTSDLVGEIRQTALEFGLMSEFTSFVAVDSASQTEGKEGTTVTVPVPVPKGVKYETTVPEKK